MARRVITTAAIILAAVAPASVPAVAAAAPPPVRTVVPPGNARFVDALARDLYGRPAVRSEDVAWTQPLDRGATTRRAVARDAVRAQRWRRTVAGRLYARVLDRAPSTDEAGYWATRLHDGMRTADAAAAIAASPELYALVGSTPEAYVDTLYRIALGRAADPGGRQYWVARIAGGEPRPVAARNLFRSLEGSTVRVRSLYRFVLRRPADAAGLSFWSRRLTSTDDQVLTAELLASGEYLQRAQDRDDGTVARRAALSSGVEVGSVSDDGDRVAFTSRPDELAPPQTGSQVDVFVDTVATGAGTRTRVTTGDAPSATPVLAGDGGTVAFTSRAGDLVAGDDVGSPDVFVTDLAGGTTTRVTATSAAFVGTLGTPLVSDDGSRVVFARRVTTVGDPFVAGVYVWDAGDAGPTLIPSSATWTVTDLSGDGRTVVASADDDGTEDVVLWDVDTATATPVTDGNGDSTAASITDDGDVVFQSTATDLGPADRSAAEDVHLWDHATGAVTRLSPAAAGRSLAPSVSDDGRIVVWSSVGTAGVAAPDGLGAVVLDRSVGVVRALTAAGSPLHGATVSGDGRTVVGRDSGDGDLVVVRFRP